jgi:hypothetical protein
MPSRPGRRSKAKGKGAAQAVPSLEDDLQAEATRAAARAAGHWLQEAVLKHNNDRMVRTLTIEQLEGLATAAISGWLTERAKQAHRIGKPESLIDLIREVPAIP